MQITQNQKPIQKEAPLEKKAASPQAMRDVKSQGSKKSVQSSVQSSKDQLEKGDQRDDKDDFEGALKQAEVAVAQSTASPAVKNLPKEKEPEKESESSLSLEKQAVVSGVASQPVAVSAQAVPVSVGTSSGNAVKAQVNSKISLMDDSRIQAKNATGTNAMSALAGLKPWSKDWVVGNEISKSPELQTLFGGNQRGQADALAQIDGEMISQQNPLNLEQILKGKPSSGANTEKSESLQPQNLAAKEMNNQSSLDPWAALLAGTNGNSDVSSLQSVEKNIAELGAGLGMKQMQSADVSSQSPLTKQASPMTSMTGAEFLNAFQMAAKPTVSEARASLAPNVKGNESKLGLSSLSSEGVTPLGASLAGGSLKGLKKVNGLESKELPNSLNDLQANQQNLLSAGAHSSAASNTAGGFTTGIAASELTAHVAKGSMAQDRLSTDTVTQLTNGIRSFESNGSGEMRIHLKPDNLGELHLKVKTNGKEVGIEIQASNEQARKVLEESLPSLKESLANQSLNLIKTDVAVGIGLGMKDAHAQMGQGSDFMNQSSNQSTSNLFSENSQKQFGNPQGDGSSGSQSRSSNGDRELDRSAIAGWSSMTSSSGRPRAASGRLDVMA